MKKAVCALMAAVLCAGVFTACGNSLDTDIGTPGTPEGKWELVQAEEDGKVLDAKKENWFEQFDIKGAEGKYTVKYQNLDKTYDVTVEKKSGDEYEIKMKGVMTLGTAKFGEKKMVYEMGNDKSKTTLVYEKK